MFGTLQQQAMLPTVITYNALISTCEKSFQPTQAVEVLGAERILFGSDSSFFPRGWREDVFDAQLDVFQKVGLNEEQVALILGCNLERALLSEDGTDA